MRRVLSFHVVANIVHAPSPVDSMAREIPDPPAPATDAAMCPIVDCETTATYTSRVATSRSIDGVGRRAITIRRA